MASVPTTVYVNTQDGWRLGMRVFRAAGSSQGALLCGHAMMTDGSYFEKPRGEGFASFMAGRGFDVFVPDFRGHGLSAPRAHEGGRWSFDDFVDGDWPALRAAAAKLGGCPEADLGVLGHSLGGLVTVADAARTGFRARRTLFLTANMWDMTVMERFPERVKAHLINAILTMFVRLKMPFPARRFGIGNCDEAPDYAAQFLGWARTGRFLSRSGFDYGSGVDKWGRDAVAIVGDGDWMCSPGGSRRFVRSTATGIPVIEEGFISGLPIRPNHFDLIRNPSCRPFHARVADFFESGRFPSLNN